MAKLDRSEEKEAFWRMVLDEHQKSGLNIRQFCKREGLGEASFYFWRREIENRDRQGDSVVTGSKMIPVNVIEPEECMAEDWVSSNQAAAVPCHAPIEVVTPAGFMIRSGDCDSGTIDAVVRLAQALADQNKRMQVTSC